MDTKSLEKEADMAVEETSNKKDKNKKELEKLDKELLSKDDEIKQLKAKLAEAQKVNKMKPEDIRAKVNREGDIARVCIGVNANGQRDWKKATELTDADIERREEYIRSIKQANAKKYG
jgi:organic radical activating enzyme